MARAAAGSCRRRVAGWIASATLAIALSPVAPAQSSATARPGAVLFESVRVFDAGSARLTGPTNVLVVGNTIHGISSGPIAAPPGVPVLRIPGVGRTLIPGLIDVHVHLTFGAMTQAQMSAPGLTAQRAEDAAAEQAAQMLLRGFTAVRDVGGPVFGLKQRIDSGRTPGPRIWPSGPVVSQTAGHGDFRLPNEASRRFTGKPSRSELLGANFIADGRDEVLTAVRENLRMGASQIKLMAGGGTSSIYDPIDVTQYTFDEMRAAVEAAEDWNTYVTVHAYTPRAMRRAIEAGVKCIEHGQLADEETLKLMAEKGVWLSAQNLIANSPDMDPMRREKRMPVLAGQARLWPLARKYGVKIAWGTDFLFEPRLNAQQNAYILELKPWFTPAEILKLLTHDNAQLLALSGPRSPYAGRLGVIEEGALADLILVRGDPVADIDLLADPARNFEVIVKDGVVVKGGS